MTHLTAPRNGLLCLLAATAIAGCATVIHGTAGRGTAGVPAPASVAAASTAAPASTAASAPTTSAVDQQVSSIDNQLSTIDGQVNAANAGLSTNEGDPAQ